MTTQEEFAEYWCEVWATAFRLVAQVEIGELAVTWKPARPEETPGELVPGEGDEPVPMDLTEGCGVMGDWAEAERDARARYEQHRAEEAATAEARKTVYLDVTPFAPDGSYQVDVTGEGVLIYSECCAELMSEATARRLHEALGRWLADQPGYREERP